MSRKSLYQTFEQWHQHGIDHGYDQRSPSSLRKSKNKEEGSWIDKGYRKEWAKDFPFQGLRYNVNEINPQDLESLLDVYIST